GRAIVREPKVFLMDEPLSNLDAKLRNQMRAELIKLHKRINTTFIYVTHDQTEAMTLGDRIVVMKDGFIQQIGTPQEVFNHPANIFVAGFIGTPQMNFFDAELVRSQDTYTVVVNGLKIALTEKMNTALLGKSAKSQSISLGIRPEHLSLVKPGEADSVTADIDVSEMMGSEMHLHLSVGERDVVIRVPTLELDEYHGKTGNETQISFKFPSALIHMFSKEDGMNLICA
ncbi:MAG: TOBE domain-containing protein, partial [Clostridiales bacterium]|nr:TOBE domain-containing protein [Clostridiales bacterium]